MPACESCQHGAPKGNCSTCGNKLLGNHRDKGPYPVTLCPGACFGYFQTQWRKWDEVCPYPYLGAGVSDAPKPPVPVVNVPRVGSELSPPRPVDPKLGDPKGATDPKGPGLPVPPVPPVPNKFGP